MSKYQLLDPLSPEEFELLEKDILERGIQVPIEFDTDGNILDGHTRMSIAEKHGLEYPHETKRFKSEDAKKIHVIMLNMARRQLKTHQSGGLLKQLCKLKGVKRGQNSSAEKQHSESATVADLVKEVGMSQRTAERRMEQHDVYEKLPKKDRKAIDSGVTSISSAVRKKKQDEGRADAAKTAKITGKFSVVLADPPWKYGSSTVTGGADQHYPTLPTDEICDMNVEEHVTKNAVLFLWSTNPLLLDALDVIEAWAFNYKTCFVWLKDKATAGLGVYARGKHELLLVATRGSMVPEKKDLPESVIVEPKGDHSRKPESVYGMIESLFPGQKYCELFARRKRSGWTSHGSEIK